MCQDHMFDFTGHLRTGHSCHHSCQDAMRVPVDPPNHNKKHKKWHKKHGCCYSPGRAGYTWWTQPIKSLQGKGFKWRTKYSLICLPQHFQRILFQTWNTTRSTLWNKHQVSKCCARHRKTYYTLRACLFNINAEDIGLCSLFARCCLDKVRGKVPLSQRS